MFCVASLQEQVQEATPRAVTMRWIADTEYTHLLAVPINVLTSRELMANECVFGK